MKIVISLGGSIVVPDKLDVKLVNGFSDLIKKYKKKHKFSIVVGGGSVARIYTRQKKNLKLSVDDVHHVAIKATHVNAMLLARKMKAKFSEEHPLKIGKMKKIVVSGGYKPGWTTDTDAALIAKSMKADLLINITNVKGVYTSDPNKNKNAEFIHKMGWKRFEDMFGKKIGGAGKHYVFDPVAGQICKKSKIKVFVVGKNLKNLENIFNDRKFVGTIIN